MSYYSSSQPASIPVKPSFFSVNKRLPILLFSYMLLLSLVQAVTHIAVPAARPPQIPPVPITRQKDCGNRKKGLCQKNSSDTAPSSMGVGNDAVSHQP
ncbi:MAG: hypothetical protein F6K31_32845 [Symploca sp. SIO2G7]|nr:hypothetical protein [Symploca sp. SIO2G7]